MKKQDKGAVKKEYQKPACQKDEMLAQFATACCKTPSDPGCAGKKTSKFNPHES